MSIFVNIVYIFVVENYARARGKSVSYGMALGIVFSYNCNDKTLILTILYIYNCIMLDFIVL